MSTATRLDREPGTLQACPHCNATRQVAGTVVQKCDGCGAEAFDMAEMPYRDVLAQENKDLAIALGHADARKVELEERLEKIMQENRRLRAALEIIAFHYTMNCARELEEIIGKPDGKQWCAWCGVWGNHTSGSCLKLGPSEAQGGAMKRRTPVSETWETIIQRRFSEEPNWLAEQPKNPWLDRVKRLHESSVSEYDRLVPAPTASDILALAAAAIRPKA